MQFKKGKIKMNDIYDILDENTVQETPNENKPFDKSAWGEKKRVEKDHAYEMIANTTAEISGDGGKLKAYLDVQSRMDKYSVGNAILILTQNPTVTQLKDYDGWKEAGTGVRPKEKGVIILEPAGEYIRDDGTTAVSYNTKKVFDVSQTFAKDKVKPQVNHDERFILKSLVKDPVVPIKAVDSLQTSTMGAYYDNEKKTVFVRRGLENSDFFMSVAQELAHAQIAKDGNYSRSDTGFNAYCVSYMLCKKYGIDTKSFEFKELPENFKNQESGDVRNALTSIRKTMTEINDRMGLGVDKAKSQKQKDYER